MVYLIGHLRMKDTRITMADVSITIRRTVDGSDTTIMVTGKIDDTALDPITNQLSQLLYTSATASSATPAPATPAT